MQLIEARRVQIVATRADNRLHIYLNGQQVHVVEGDGDPLLNKTIAFDVPYGLNSLVVIGVNFHGPSNFAFRILVDGEPRDKVEQRKRTAELGIQLVRQYLIANPDHPSIEASVS